MAQFAKNSRQVTNRQEIRDLLQVAQTYRWVFSYAPISSDHVVSHTTEIVGLDPDAGTITVTSEVKYSDSEPDEPFIFRAQSGGINIRFESRIIQVGGNSLSMLLFSDCRVQFPEQITVNQLRQAVRVNFLNLADIPVTYFAEQGKQIEGSVEDLSTSGARIKFNGNLKYQFNESDIISDCQMVLPDGQLVSARIKVLGFIYDDSRDVSYIRCRFLELADDSSLRIKELIEEALHSGASEVAIA